MAESHDSSDLIYFATKFIVLAGLSSGHLKKWEQVVCGGLIALVRPP